MPPVSRRSVTIGTPSIDALYAMILELQHNQAFDRAQASEIRAQTRAQSSEIRAQTRSQSSQIRARISQLERHAEDVGAQISGLKQNTTDLEQNTNELWEALMDPKAMDRLRLRGILDQARLSLMQVFKPTADDKEWPAFAKTHSPTKLINTPEYQSSAWSDLGLEHLAFLYDDTNQYRSRSTEVAYNFADPPFMQAVETIHIEEDRNIMTQLLNILQHSSGLNHQ